MSDHFVLFNRKFDHSEQVKLCARHLGVMRADLGNAWWKLGAAAAHADENAVPDSAAWTPEKRTLAKHLIRHATESANFPTTVDFITITTREHIRAMRAERKRCTTGALKQWGLFTHEHMVPGSEVLRLLTDPAYAPNRAGDLAPLLDALSWRALVTGTKRKKAKGAATFEIGQLDARYADSLPRPGDVPDWHGPADYRAVPPQYLALMRYDAAGLIGLLEPVSVRADRAIAQYGSYKAESSVQGM